MVDLLELPQVRALVEQLRARDAHPDYANTPILDAYGRISVNPGTGETETVDRRIMDTLADVSRLRRVAAKGLLVLSATRRWQPAEERLTIR